MSDAVIVDVFVERLFACLIEILAHIGTVSANAVCKIGKTKLGIEIDLVFFERLLYALRYLNIGRSGHGRRNR